ncbi:MAG: aminotransferase class I/II-fold pyridoxal phosphate-dependent enzyme [Thermanaeromonas sp.]|nr:aminotransferase class I/II-fold pyridoxal phosphate-dependent enzyme [Thermanaeromonas sp.]
MFSWHTPGHKGGAGAAAEFRTRLGRGVFQADLTELPELDNLYYPEGPIREAQERAAAFFGAGRTFFLVNGATSGIASVILATCRPGDKVLVPRYAHRSVWSGLILSGSRPVYLKGCWLSTLGLPLGVTPGEVEEALALHKGVKLLVLVHPTYEGLVPPTGRLVKLAHRYKVQVLVDAAHGSHFGLDDRLPPSPLKLGADYVVHGTHKTLGAFTQAAMLHLRAGLDGDGVAEALRLLQTSSPSYLLLASLDMARYVAELKGYKLWAKAVDRALKLRQRLRELGLPCLEEGDVVGEAAAGLDVTRLVIPTGPLGLSGEEAAAALRRLGHEMELARTRYVVAILTPGDDERSTGSFLRALRTLRKEGAGRGSKPLEELPAGESLPPLAMTPREAFFARHRSVPVREAQGKIAAELVAPCPPGYVVVAPGEVLTPEIVDRLTLIRGKDSLIRVVDV